MSESTAAAPGANDGSEPVQPFAGLPTWFRSLALVGILALAGYLLHRELRAIRWSDVAKSVHALPLSAMGISVLFTALNFVVLMAYDWTGLKLVRHNLRLRQVAATSLVAYSFGNSLGVFLGATPVRLRMYTAAGLSTADVLRLVLFIGFGFWMGLFCLGGALFLGHPFAIPSGLPIGWTDSRPLGWTLLALAAMGFGVCALRKEPLRWKRLSIQTPPFAIAAVQALIATFDLMLAAAALFVLLPSDLGVGYFAFAAIYILAVVVALLSHVPGGIGVLELVLVAFLPEASHALVASLLVYRVIYYLLPLALATLSVSGWGLFRLRDEVSEIATQGVTWWRVLGPRIVTAGVFLAGLVLLVSGSLPAAEGRLPQIHHLVPLPLMEVSHFLGSLVGAGLLVVARGLQRRIDTAWIITLGMLVLGALLSLAKGLDYEEALFLLVMFLALLPCKAFFYRKGNLLSSQPNVPWTLAVLTSMAVLVGLLLFAYKHVEYSNELWWRFAYKADAPRSMRSLVGAGTLLALFSFYQLLRPKRSLPPLPGPEELATVRSIVAASGSTEANLALLGDKRILFSSDQKALVMFGCEGRSWVSMGDPVGPRGSADDAAWSFLELCDEKGVWPVFYQVHDTHLGRYVEMGLSVLKVGEEALVSLSEFSLEGGRKADLRRTCRKASEAGLVFEVVSRDAVPALLPQLKVVSDAWLGEKSGAEKGFSLGYFDEAYLLQFDFALVREGESILAFSNLWQTADRSELSVDLMRFLPDRHPGVMEFLFTQIMLWGKEQGFARFNLGMAPLAGVDPHRLGPLWNQISSLIYRRGEHFYNFQGLRNYKDKFDPEWHPRYIASPGGLATPQIMANVTSLISGGILRLLRK